MARSHITKIDISTIRSLFTMPIEDAAKYLGISVTVLKRNCRAKGISRWPYRKIRSIDNMIKELENKPSSTRKIVLQINKLKEKRDSIIYGEPIEEENAYPVLQEQKKDWNWNPSSINSSNTTFTVNNSLPLPLIENKPRLPSFSSLIETISQKKEIDNQYSFVL